MRKTRKFLGVIGMSLLLVTSLSGCDIKPLPHDERYQYIDDVLKTIDYETAGDIIEEKIDDGDGVFAPSYKKVYYGNNGSFEELEKRLRSSSDTCSGSKKIGQINCSYPATSVSVFHNKDVNNEFKYESVIRITDSSGGRAK